MDLFQELLAVVSTLQAAGVEFALCGGLALAVHGLPRFTRDIDLLVRAADVERIVELVKPLGFDFDVGLIPIGIQAGQPTEVRRVTKNLGAEWLPLDLMAVGPETEEMMHTRGTIEWNQVSIPAVTLLGLAKMKRRAGRPRDLLDIESLGYSPDDPRLQE
jgi:hypothetical protein